MREERLMVHPFEDFKVLDYRGRQEVNQHACAVVKGLIPFDRREAYVRAGKTLSWVTVTAAAQEGEEILFYGIMESMEIDFADGLCTVTLRLSSGTGLMDHAEHTRSFQSQELTYQELLEACGRDYENFAYIMTAGKRKQIPHFLMQYRETDWAFVKRLASMNQTVLVADCSTKGEKYFFGLPDRPEKGEKVGEYTLQWDMKEYWHKKENGMELRPEDTASYVWTTREICKLGDKKIIEGKTRYIWKLESEMRGNELYHTCFFKTETGLFALSQKNPALSGVSLSGRVKAVSGEKVQLALEDDEYQARKNFCWFSFSTVYSFADGSGWYCMPELGDRVRLYFPTGREEEAYVSSAYHEEGAGLRTDPEKKFWRNKEGKEIQLSPDRILLTNNDGTYIELSDRKGIKMVSESTISLWADGALRICSGSEIELSAPGDVTLRQGNTKMNLGGDITMRGARVML